MKKLIMLTILAGATFVASTTPSQASSMKDPTFVHRPSSHMRHQSQAHTGHRANASDLLESSVAVYVRGQLAFHPIHPLTSGRVRAG